MRGAGDQFQAMIAAEARAAVGLVGFYLYQVTEDAGGATLRPLNDIDGLPSSILPGQLAAPKGFGLPGATAQLAVGDLVLVGFQAGDPGAPFLGFYLAGPLPVAVAVDATSITLGGVAAGPLAKAGVVDVNLALIVAKIDAICAALSIAPLGSLSSTATTKVRGE